MKLLAFNSLNNSLKFPLKRVFLDSNMTSNCQTSGTGHNIRGLISNAGAGAAAGNFVLALMGFFQNLHFLFPILVSAKISIFLCVFKNCLFDIVTLL